MLNASFFEVLGHLISKFDEDERQVHSEQMKYYMDFIAMLNSSPQNEKQAKQTEKFRKQIEPQSPGKKEKNESGEDLKSKYQWNDRVRQKIEAKNKK